MLTALLSTWRIAYVVIFILCLAITWEDINDVTDVVILIILSILLSLSATILGSLIVFAFAFVLYLII